MSLDPAVPDPSVDTRPWWGLLREGTLTMPTCEGCRSRFFPPQPFCPRCGSPDVALVTCETTGRVYSWVTIHRPLGPPWANHAPYAIVAVHLDEGGRLIGRFLADPSGLDADMRVDAELYEQGGFRLLGFVPHVAKGAV
jgi:uncharacterized OB-fold protein